MTALACLKIMVGDELQFADADTMAAQGLVHAMAGEHPQAVHRVEAAEALDANCVTSHLVRAILSGESSDLQALQALVRRLTDTGAAR